MFNPDEVHALGVVHDLLGRHPVPRSGTTPGVKEFRDAVCDVAGDSRRANPWGAKIYYDPTQHGALKALLNAADAAWGLI